MSRAAFIECVKMQSRDILFDEFLTLLDRMVNTGLPDCYWIIFGIGKPF